MGAGFEAFVNYLGDVDFCPSVFGTSIIFGGRCSLSFSHCGFVVRACLWARGVFLKLKGRAELFLSLLWSCCSPGRP